MFTQTTTPPPPVPTTLTITYKAGSTLPGATVTGTATNGTCTGAATSSTSMTCTVTAGIGSVSLQSTGGVFIGWTGDCTGSTNPYVITAPTKNFTCQSGYLL